MGLRMYFCIFAFAVCCFACGPDEYKDAADQTCKPCEANHWNPPDKELPRCFLCKTCGHMANKTGECGGGAGHDTECTCKPGYYPLTPQSDFCVPWSPMCLPGTYEAQKPDEKHNRECKPCPPRTYSFKNQALCTEWTECQFNMTIYQGTSKHDRLCTFEHMTSICPSLPSTENFTDSDYSYRSFKFNIVSSANGKCDITCSGDSCTLSEQCSRIYLMGQGSDVSGVYTDEPGDYYCMFTNYYPPPYITRSQHTTVACKYKSRMMRLRLLFHAFHIFNEYMFCVFQFILFGT
uniref:TNFR n=1 Tax=Blueface angelfish adomavirus TaxID=2609871 RepID=A0A6F9F3K0_9VIRU|nr:TPA_asm: TNFR [Blueface angelfish adomavirus]